jgi:hypothetical protein
VLHRIAFSVVSEWCQKVTDDQGSVRLEGGEGVVITSLSFTDGVATVDLAAVSALFYSSLINA